MLKIRINVLVIILGLLIGSCGKNIPSFQELKEAETEAINNLIAKENFEILNRYPANGVFGEKQFVLLDNGCYLNVIDSGNGKRAIAGKTVVLMRCSTRGITPSDSLDTYSIFGNGNRPLEFVFGNMQEAKTRAKSGQSGDDAYSFLSLGVESALEYVGDNAVVRMIVPFDNGQSNRDQATIGSAYQDNVPIPLYYDRIKFVFDEN